MAPTMIKKKLCKNIAHKLREEDKGEKYVCDGCKTNGKGRKYICKTCDGYFHHECIDFKPKFCPEMFKEEKGSYEFEFSRSLPPRRKSSKRQINCLHHRNCEACGMRVEGYAYRCKKTDKDLHPRCAFLDKEILVPLADDDQVKLELRKGEVMLNSNINDCCNICQSAELPAAAAAAAVNEKIPGWCYISDDGEISFHVFCMLQIWFKNSTANHGGPKLLEESERQQITAETQDNQYSKKYQAGGSGGAVTKVIVNGNHDPNLQVEELDKKDERETDNKYSKNKGGGGRNGIPKKNGNDTKPRELGKHERDQSQHHVSKKRKRGGWGGRKFEFCMKIIETVLSALLSTLIGDFTGLVAPAVLQAVKSAFDYYP